MNILLTGPSGAGKTSLAPQLNAARIVPLDRGAGALLPAAASVVDTGVTLYEGIPTGADAEVAAFLAGMDLVLWLDAAWRTRLGRCAKRDGAAGVFRWVWNEYWWRRVTRPLIERHPHIRKVNWQPEDSDISL